MADAGDGRLVLIALVTQVSNAQLHRNLYPRINLPLLSERRPDCAVRIEAYKQSREPLKPLLSGTFSAHQRNRTGIMEFRCQPEVPDGYRFERIEATGTLETVSSAE